ncbi:hypothetical protein TTHERM_00129940 (macronuclear) [Tetrahymena thermophila SB210]|uniref:Uncharacterized protein n=1 Tax=Tetrahymena thermophila (strain SB210) TaxID=312017 RepID=I7MEF2_TETTS|nr:hypothetical protein TTHERM_00129940 [Tetrahymena thermophila SB210]EAR96217.1 hypothetical protein TTHERM_00129940 [Tetrahymena thermophila SB210]|eukprot:XP_001016462.1 hypothetical protein TTHERM_00129940 [Tetrahymena thermophila SB210]
MNNQRATKNLWREFMRISNKQLKKINDKDFTEFVRSLKYSERGLKTIKQLSKCSENVKEKRLAEKYITQIINQLKIQKIIVKRTGIPNGVEQALCLYIKFYDIISQD